VIPSVLTHPDTDLHLSPGHPEGPARRAAAVRGVQEAEVEVCWRTPEPAALEALERAHPAAYLAALERACAAGARIDADTYTTPASWHAARLAAGAAIEAIDLAAAGTPALSLMRPPGHHAEPTAAMGFCLLANAAIAVRHAQAVLGAGRVAVLDWDVHHGNGTQAVFWEDPTVLAVSLHQYPLWPMTGLAEETGAGPGRGTTLNVPLPPGTRPDAYLARFEGEVLPAMEDFAPDLIVVASGFDAHHADPLAELELDARTFGALAARVMELCARLDIPPPAVLLEGGYDLDAMRTGTRAVVRALAG
jgi:acetoin utilization deacetylase AcuC-like enzyme